MKTFNRILKRIPLIKQQIERIKGPNLKDSLLKVIKKDDPVIIDVGANTGQTIDYMLTLFKKPTIYSFEPTKELVQGLLEKYSKMSNVEIFDMALSDKSGETEFYKSDFSQTNSLLKPDMELYKKYAVTNICKIFDESLHAEKISISTFKDWYKNNLDNTYVDIFKIDTQGYDYNVIKGGYDILPNIGCIITEIQFENFYQESAPFYKMIEYLYENNFVLYSFFEIHRFKGIQFLECDALFVNRSIL